MAEYRLSRIPLRTPVFFLALQAGLTPAVRFDFTDTVVYSTSDFFSRRGRQENGETKTLSCRRFRRRARRCVAKRVRVVENAAERRIPVLFAG